MQLDSDMCPHARGPLDLGHKANALRVGVGLRMRVGDRVGRNRLAIQAAVLRRIVVVRAGKLAIRLLVGVAVVSHHYVRRPGIGGRRNRGQAVEVALPPTRFALEVHAGAFAAVGDGKVVDQLGYHVPVRRDIGCSKGLIRRRCEQLACAVVARAGTGMCSVGADCRRRLAILTGCDGHHCCLWRCQM